MLRDKITVLFFGDVMALLASLFFMTAIRFSHVAQSAYRHEQIRAFLYLFVLWLVIFFIFDLYNVRRANPNPRNIGLLGLAIIVAVMLSVLYFYLFPTSGTPKTNLAIVAGAAFILLVTWRRIFYSLYSIRFSQRIAMIGKGETVVALIEDINRHPQIGRVVYANETYSDSAPIPDIDLIISHDVPLDLLFRAAQQKKSDILSLTEAYEQLFGKVPLLLITEEKALSVFAQKKNLGQRIIERFIEIVFALLVLIATSPFLLIAILAILMEDGKPIIFRQMRVGKNGKPFIIYKLRTMKALAPDGSAELSGIQWAEKKDNRITSVGSILRKTHIDEVPQMFNLLKGDIALVGPRPERPEFVAELEQRVPYYFLRHTVKPGFTGWAQIKFRYARSELDSREKFEYDLYWLMKHNPMFDLGIIAKTVQIIFTH